MARYDLMLGVTSAEAFVLLNQEVFQQHHDDCLDQDHQSDPDQDHQQDHHDQIDDVQEMELGLETEGRNKLVSDFVTATFQVIIIIIIADNDDDDDHDDHDDHAHEANDVSAPPKGDLLSHLN